MDFDQLVQQNADAFSGLENVGNTYKSISKSLNDLGYDLLLNNRQKASFIPASRLGEVISQRDLYKGQIDVVTKELESLKESSKTDDELTKRFNTLLQQNENLSNEVNELKLNSAIMTMAAANNAIVPKDVLYFIDKNNVKIDKKGQVIGVESEIERLKKEKSYLFSAGSNKGGLDTSLGGGEDEKLDMNTILRRAAGRL